MSSQATDSGYQCTKPDLCKCTYIITHTPPMAHAGGCMRGIKSDVQTDVQNVPVDSESMVVRAL